MNNSGWHRKNYRRNLVDMHIEAWNPEFMAKFDPDAYVSCMIKANVSCCMVYANSHAGYAYWPAPGGNQHPGLKGRDVFGEITDLCHKNNIAVIAYYTLVYDNWAYKEDPAWRIVNAGGTTGREQLNSGGRYGLVCPNSPGYREFTGGQVGDLVSRYDFESIFFDMTFWPSVCYCANCKTRYEKEIGGIMPRIVNWDDPVWNRFQDAREKWLNDFAFFATDTVKAIKPHVTVNHQYSSIKNTWMRGVTEDHTDACDYVGGDFYAGPTEQGLICKLFNSLTGSFEFHTSRCTGLGDHTTVKSMEQLRLHSYIALAHNGAFLFIDAVDPAGTLNSDFYEGMGSILRDFQEYEKYLGGEMIADVAVLFDMWSKFDERDNGKSVMDGNLGRIPHLDAVVGAVRALKEKHIPYTVIGRRNLKKAVGKYRVIVLPGVLRLSGEAADDIKSFVKAGGRVYASGQSGIQNLCDMFGIERMGETSQDFTYMAPTEAGRRYLADSTLQYPLAVNQKQQIVRALPGTGILATQVLPYTEKTGMADFASIHSNPPGIPTENPAMVRRNYGQGRIIYLTGVIENRSESYHDRVFIACVEDLLDGKHSVDFDAPPAAEAVCFAQEDGIIVSVLTTQTTLPPVTAYGTRLTLDLKGRSCARVLFLPGETETAFTEKDGKVCFDLPPLELFLMFKAVYR
jgi:hypothetical protein